MIAALFLFVSTETNARESLPATTYSETSNHYYSEVIEFDQNAQCGNLIDVIVREDYVLLSECIELCETLQNCTMVQYYDRLLSDADSRCYVFDEICELSTNVGDRANTSHIYYKNQLTKTYCVDYPEWIDKYGDSCDIYALHGLCTNKNISDKATVDQFEEAKDPVHGWTARDVCCACGGGEIGYGNTATSFISEDTYNEYLPQCSFKSDMTSTTHLAEWNSFALYQLAEDMNHKLHSQYPLANNLFIYTDLVDVRNTTQSLVICDFSLYETSTSSKQISTDFFIFASVQNQYESLYFVNGEYFNINVNAVSQYINIAYHDFEYCNNYISDAISSDESMRMIIPCFMHYAPLILSTTEAPYTSQITIGGSNTQKGQRTWLDKYAHYLYDLYPIDHDNWVYWVMIGLSLLLLFICCCMICYCCICRSKRKAKDYQKVNQNPSNRDRISDDNDGPSTMLSCSPHHTHTDENETCGLIQSDIIEVDDNGNTPCNQTDDNQTYDQMQITNHSHGSYGSLIYQSKWYCDAQMAHIYNTFSANGRHGPQMLFGDNDVDRSRAQQTTRKYSKGQAKIMGPYDRDIAYGIVTAFYAKPQPEFNAFTSLIDKLFKPLQVHLRTGCDVVIPAPTAADIRNDQDRYCKLGKQVIFHNIGTGIAKLPLNYIEYIQLKCDELKRYAQSSKTVQYYDYSPHSKPQVTQKPQVIYQCSFSS